MAPRHETMNFTNPAAASLWVKLKRRSVKETPVNGRQFQTNFSCVWVLREKGSFGCFLSPSNAIFKIQRVHVVSEVVKRLQRRSGHQTKTIIQVVNKSPTSSGPKTGVWYNTVRHKKNICYIKGEWVSSVSCWWTGPALHFTQYLLNC